MKPRPGITYARVSTGRQTTGNSLTIQKAELHAYCVRNNLDRIAHYTDEGKTGTTRDGRDRLDAAMALVCATKGVLVVYDGSRLGRNARDVLAIIDEIRDAGGDVEYVCLPFKDNPEGRFMVTVDAGVAELLSAKIGQKIKLNNDSRKTNRGRYKLGYRSQGQQIAGYTSEDGGIKTEVAAEQRVVREVKRISKIGFSLSKVAKKLNEAGVPTISMLRNRATPKTVWTKHMVRHLLIGENHPRRKTM